MVSAVTRERIKRLYILHHTLTTSTTYHPTLSTLEQNCILSRLPSLPFFRSFRPTVSPSIPVFSFLFYFFLILVGLLFPFSLCVATVSVKDSFTNTFGPGFTLLS